MGRRKGEVTARIIDRTHPFQVEIVAPLTGLGNAMDIMLRWAAPHAYETRGAGTSGMRWCFRSRALADAFAADCGGMRIDLPHSPDRLEPDRPDDAERARRARLGRFGLER